MPRTILSLTLALALGLVRLGAGSAHPCAAR
jgi:hypothetical protein